MPWKRSVLTAVVVLFLSACVTNPVLGPSADGSFEAGLSLYEQGRYEEAIEQFKRALDIDPEHAQSYLYLGRSLFNLGRWLEAVSYLRSAYLRVPPDQQNELVGELLDSMLNGALELLQKGNFVNAIALLKEALRLEPDSSRAKEDLGEVLMAFGHQLFSDGRFNDAIDAYSQSLDLTPGKIQSYLGLARSFLHKGEISKALKTLKNALQTSPESDELKSLFNEILQGS